MAPTAHLAMYDMTEVRPAAQRWWETIAPRLPAACHQLLWPADVEAACRAPGLVLAQTCGLPLVTTLAGAVAVVGRFAYTGAGDADGCYRSVVVARDPGPLAGRAGSLAAVNSWHSLSGWASLGVAVAAGVPAADDTFFAGVVVTGAHVASVAAVVDGRADVASVDAVTFALLQRHRPRAVHGLHVVGRGPRVPCLPLVTARADDVPDLRAALARAVVDPAGAEARAVLLLDAFVPCEADAYDVVHGVAAVAATVLPRP